MGALPGSRGEAAGGAIDRAIGVEKHGWGMRGTLG